MTLAEMWYWLTQEVDVLLVLMWGGGGFTILVALFLVWELLIVPALESVERWLNRRGV